jgi:hypothetical protein
MRLRGNHTEHKQSRGLATVGNDLPGVRCRTFDEVLEIYEQQIERYGGSAGLREAAGLESAVATPQSTFGGGFLHTSIRRWQ